MEILSLIVLIAIILLSCFTKINPGLLALAAAWLLGTFGAGMSTQQIVAGFPTYLFIVLVAVTYLFSIAKHNGTLEKISQVALHLFKGKPLWIPILFFFLAILLSTLGAGNIATVALLAPIAMNVAWETGTGAFFMTILLICGANAGTFSPMSLTGIIANGLVDKLNIPYNPWIDVYLPNLLAESLLALLCYLIFYWRLKQRITHHPIKTPLVTNPKQWTLSSGATITAILLLFIGCVFFKLDIGFLALLLASMLVLFNLAESKEAIKLIPWNTILMICGVNTLIGILESMGGIDLITKLIANISNPTNVTAVLAFITGIISAFSSSSGVVMPTFIPLVPDIIKHIGGGNPMALVSSINVGAHLVDISPLSSLGALCIASALHEDKEKLFRQLLLFGLFMSVAGALLCFILFR